MTSKAGFLGEFEHGNKLKVRENQLMIFGDNSEDGPFWLSMEEREAQWEDIILGAVFRDKVKK